MNSRKRYIGAILLLAALVALTAACNLTPPPAPTAGPTFTPWVIVVTATSTPSGPPPPTEPPTPGPSPTAPPTPVIPPTATRVPPTPTLPPPEPNPPVVGIIAPANGAQFSVGQVVNVQFHAGDQSGLRLAELYVGDNRVWYNEYPQHPGSITNDVLKWTPAAAGNYTLRVVVYDVFNKYSVDQRNIVVVRNVAPPTVQMLFPTQRVVIVAGHVINIQAAINDEAGLQSLELVERVGGQEVIYTRDTVYHGAPYVWQVGWQSPNPGDHTLFVRARDTAGGTGQSPDFIIGVTDNNPPQIQVGYNATVLRPGDTLQAHVEAGDSKGVKEIRLVIDGNVVDRWTAPDPSIGQSHASVDLWWRNVTEGNHAAHVWAVDTQNNQAQTPDQGIQVVPAPPPPPPPPTATPVPPAPSLVGSWGGRPDPSQSFIIIITGQDGPNLQGTFTIRSEDGQSVTGMLVNSTIQDNNVTIHAQVGSEMYNFMLTLSANGRQLNGSWSMSRMGMLQPITFERLLT